MKVFKIAIPIIIIISILSVDYYNKYYKDNTDFENESIYLYVIKDDSLGFTDSISKYFKSTKTFYKVAEKLDYLNNKKTGRFKIEKGIGNNEIVRSLKFNNTPVNVTFNNQERIENLASRVSKQILEDSLSLIKAFRNEDFLKENGLNDKNVLSIFIPNSYNVYWNTTSDDFRDKMLNEYNYKELYNWDGHNEFWEGRSINHERKYNDGLNGNKYIDGELFAAMLMDIRNHIEDSTADKIILQSAYSWYPNMSFSNAIEQIMKADTLLYNAANSSIIHWLACNRGFLSASCENKTIKPLDKSKLDYFIT